MLAYAKFYEEEEEMENSEYYPPELTGDELHKYHEFCEKFDEEFGGSFIFGGKKIEEADNCPFGYRFSHVYHEIC